MSSDSTNGESPNGNGHVPPTEGELSLYNDATGKWDESQALHDLMRRLVSISVREAVALCCGEIVFDLADDGCPVHFVRGDEKLERDTMPARLFTALKDCLARLCGSIDEGQGTFTTSLKRTETSKKPEPQVRVSVTIADKCLKLTITKIKAPSD